MPLPRRSRALEDDVLCALPQTTPAEVGEVLVAGDHGQKVVAGELPHLRREAAGAVRNEDLRLTVAAGVEEDLPGRRVAGGVLEADAEIELAHGHPRRLTAPADMDDLVAEGEALEEGRA